MFEDSEIYLFNANIGDSDNTNNNVVFWEWDGICEIGWEKTFACYCSVFKMQSRIHVLVIYLKIIKTTERKVY